MQPEKGSPRKAARERENTHSNPRPGIAGALHGLRDVQAGALLREAESDYANGSRIQTTDTNDGYP